MMDLNWIEFFNFSFSFCRGTSGIDIDLRRVDIDQCPLPENSTELNIFAASDKCKNATTKVRTRYAFLKILCWKVYIASYQYQYLRQRMYDALKTGYK
jgi:hypothetical protein